MTSLESLVQERALKSAEMMAQLQGELQASHHRVELLEEQLARIAGDVHATHVLLFVGCLTNTWYSVYLHPSRRLKRLQCSSVGVGQ